VLCDALEDVRHALFDQLEGGVAAEEVFAVRREGIDVDQAFGILDPPILKEHGVDEREDRRVRSDTECERQHGNGRKGRSLGQGSYGEPQIG